MADLTEREVDDARKQLDELVTQREVEVILNLLTDEQLRGLAADWNQGREDTRSYSDVVRDGMTE
jgi:hypothetical protein